MEERVKRSNTIDYIKAFAATLMVLSHSIQCGSGENFYSNGMVFDNVLYKYIMSINMPLFMLVSGYLFFFSVKRHSLKDNFKSKLTSLFVPILIWNILITVIDMLKSGKDFSPWTFFKVYCNEVLGNLWFLWSVLICSLFVGLVNRFLNDNIFIYILIFASTFFITDIINLNLYKFMYVFFVIGFLFNKYNGIKLLKSKVITVSISLFAVIYFVMMQFYTSDYSIYVTGCCVLNKENMIFQVYINFYRIIVALLGCSVIIYVFVRMSKYIKGWLEEILVFIGKNTMGIYIISYLIDIYILINITANLSDINYLLTVLETVAILAVSCLIIMALKRISLLNKLLLGGRT